MKDSQTESPEGAGETDPSDLARDEEQIQVPEVLPALSSGSAVLFPGLVVPLASQDQSLVGPIDAAADSPNKMLAVFAQKPGEDGQPTGESYSVGTAAVIARMAKAPNGGVQALIRGVARVTLKELEQEEPWRKVRVERLRDVSEESTEMEALKRTASSLFQKAVGLVEDAPQELGQAAAELEDPGHVADFIAANINAKTEERQAALETANVAERLRLVIGYLNREVEVLEAQSRIRSQVHGEMEKNQREFILREQLKAIQKELGQSELEPEVVELEKRLGEASLPPDVRREADRELGRLRTMPQAAADYQVVRTYLEWLADLPWSVSTEDNLDLARAEEILDADHHDLEKVKRRILDFLAVRKLKPDGRGPILCFVGPPGVGKTSLGQSIARALGRKFVRMSLGGMRDEAEIRGHRRTYVGALPGRIIQELRRAEANNPLIMLDEVDKLGSDFRGDPASALLEVLDPEQNFSFTDHYLDVPFDLSRVMFITTANVMDTIPAPLLDRMETIELAGYTEREKLEIARRYLIPRQMEANGLPEGRLAITDDAVLEIIRGYTREAGVRNLEREIGSVCRGAAREHARGASEPTTVDASDLPPNLGPIRHRLEIPEADDEVGVATGMAATMAGGDILYVEARCVSGKGHLTLTGKLGEVMQESAQAAMTYARSRFDDLKVPSDFLEKHDVHIHVPAGAIPKDGPSAGVTMAAALVSAMTQRPLRRQVSMTGEITLRGRVLPVGAIKDKVLAAHRVGIKTVVIPKDNEPDLEEIPEDVREDLEFILAEVVDDVLNAALQPEAVSETSRLTRVT